MKRLLLSLTVCLSLCGCIGSSMTWKVYEGGKLVKELKVNNLKAAVNTSAKSLAMNVTDGNDFSARILIVDSNVVASPESATAIGDAITNVMTGGASGVVKGALK